MAETLGLMFALLPFILSCAVSDHSDPSSIQAKQDGSAVSCIQKTDALANDDEAVAADIDDAQAMAFGGGTTQASCSASCGSSSPVTCTGSTCSAVDRNCGAGEIGHVVCNGVRKDCPTACPAPECVEGDMRRRAGSGCCCNGVDSIDLQMFFVDVCFNGRWISQDVECTGATCGGLCPI